MEVPENAQVIQDFSQAFRELEDPYLTVLYRSWYRNILYYLGEQWIQWLVSVGSFGTRFPLDTSVPTPVSNIVRDYVRSMLALILNKQYTTRVWPNSNDQEDKDAAEIGNDVSQWLEQRNDSELEDVKELVAMWTILTGNGFSRTFPDMDGNGLYLMDKGGKTITPGDVCVRAILPFNIVASHLGTTLRQKAYVGVKSLVYREWAEDAFGEKIAATPSDLIEVDYQRQLLSLVANVSPWKGAGLEGSLLESAKEDLVVFKELEYKPTKKYPNGRYAAMVNGQVVVNEARMPIAKNKDGEWHYTFDHFPYNRTPGGFWCSGGVDDLISPQNIINEVDQALAINRKSLGRPFVLTPADLTLKRISERGQALLSVQYDGRTAGGAKAQILPGVPYPQQVLEERKNHKEAAQEAAGDPRNVLRGKAPYAGAPGIAIDTLRETAEQGHAPDVRRFYRNWNSTRRKSLIIVSKLYSEQRLIKVKGRGNKVRIRRFKGAELKGNFDVRLELDSGLSTTNAGKNQFLLQLIQYGLWDPQRGPKPDVRRELLRRMGMSGFPEEENLHRDRAEYENSMIVAGSVDEIAIPPIQTEEGTVVVDDPVFELDDHFTHAQVHGELIFSREFRDLPKETQMQTILHYNYHKDELAKQILAEQALMVPPEQELEAAAGAESGAGVAGPGGEPTALGGLG